MATRNDAVSSRVAAALQVLHDRRERVTQARRAVLEILAESTEHLGADQIATRAAEQAPGVHRATVYRALTMLRRLGVVTHTHLGGSSTVFHLSAPDTAPGRTGHAHAQCTRCGAVVDVSLDGFGPLADRLREEAAFEVDAEHAALLGTCNTCRETP